MLSFDQAISHALAVKPRLVGIDGLPCSGKTTLALRLVQALDSEYLGLDDFVLPPHQWPSPHVPDFPFPYIRHAEFFAAIKTIAAGERLAFHRFDWKTLSLAAETTIIPAGSRVIIEGVSTLASEVASAYDLSVFVVSDAETTLQVAISRGAGEWTDHRRDYFMPSAAIYFKTEPAKRASVHVRGRGA